MRIPNYNYFFTSRLNAIGGVAVAGGTLICVKFSIPHAQHVIKNYNSQDQTILYSVYLC